MFQSHLKKYAQYCGEPCGTWGRRGIEWINEWNKGMTAMDLKNNSITVGQVLAYGPARALLYRELPMIMNHPMVGMARNMTLNQVMGFAQGRVPQQKINQVLAKLRQV